MVGECVEKQQTVLEMIHDLDRGMSEEETLLGLDRGPTKEEIKAVKNSTVDIIIGCLDDLQGRQRRINSEVSRLRDC